MQKFTKSNSNAFYKEVGEVLENLAKKHGMTFELGNAKFSENELSGKYTFKVAGTPTFEEKTLADLKMLHPNLVGVKVKISGKTFEVVGFDRKKRKNKLIILGEDNKRYATTTEAVYIRLKWDIKEGKFSSYE